MVVKWNLLVLAALLGLLNWECKKEANSVYTLENVSEIRVQGKSIGGRQPSSQLGGAKNGRGETTIRVKPRPRPTTKAEIATRRFEIRTRLKEIEGKMPLAGTRLSGIDKRLFEIQKEISEVLLVSFNYAKQSLRLDYELKQLQEKPSAQAGSSINIMEKEKARIEVDSKEFAKQLVALESEKQILLLEQTDLNNLSANQTALRAEDADLEVAELLL